MDQILIKWQHISFFLNLQKWIHHARSPVGCRRSQDQGYSSESQLTHLVINGEMAEWDELLPPIVSGGIGYSPHHSTLAVPWLKWSLRFKDLWAGFQGWLDPLLTYMCTQWFAVGHQTVQCLRHDSGLRFMILLGVASSESVCPITMCIIIILYYFKVHEIILEN